MKNHQMFKSAAIMAAVVIVFTLVAGLVISCGDVPEGTDAKLTSITIAGIKAENIPTAITRSDWNSGEFYDQEYTETILLKESENVKISVVISDGAKAAYGLGDGYDKPETFSSSSTLDNVTGGQAIYVRVTSGDGKTVNYYRFSIMMKSSNAQLSTLTVAGMSAQPGTPAATWNGVTVAGLLSLSNSKKENAIVVGAPIIKAATVEYALVTTAGGEPGFSATDTYTFADGNILYVKVTAENGVNINYYKIEVQIGRDATLASVKIGTAEADSLGTPQTAWGTGNWGNSTSPRRGTCQADGKMPDEGFTVEITSTDEEATVVWARTPPRGSASATVTYPEPTTYDGKSPWQFPTDASDLTIKVTSANGATTNWYQVRLFVKSYAEIYKGTPATLNADDSAWDTADWLDVSRLNTAESYDVWFGTDYGRHTTARAKVLWDDDGLWSYWDIDFIDYKTSETGNTLPRSASLSGDKSTYTPGTDITASANSVPNNAHTNDSVEFFVNERFQAQKTGNFGNQYRSGLPNADGTIWLSGEKGAAPADFNPITAFQIEKKVNAYVKKNGNKDIGYVIIMRVPWVHYGADDDQVFDANKKVIPGAEIGLELQVNACAAAGTRNGILTWNGVTSQAYQNVKSFGIVTLKASK